jgi:hypothetical protein
VGELMEVSESVKGTTIFCGKIIGLAISALVKVFFFNLQIIG